MRTYIFRNPFVTKENISLAYKYLELAEKYIRLARLTSDENGAPNAGFVYEAIEMQDKAAKICGFSNAEDMRRWIQIHGKL